MTTEKFIIDGVHYVRETFENGTINTYVDPEFSGPDPICNLPQLPPLNTLPQKLDFIIQVLRLKDGFS